DSSLKGSHFMQLCNQGKVPMLFLQNITGYMVGRDYEHRGITKDGAKMIMAVSGSEVPKITVIINGSFGAGNYGISRPALRSPFFFLLAPKHNSPVGPQPAAHVLRGLQVNPASRERA